MIHYLAIGHVAKDLTPAGWQLGGSVAYAARTAHALGYTPGIYTAYADDIHLNELGAEIACTRLPSTASTTFENIYTPAGRIQFLRAAATPLTVAGIPEGWRQAPLVHLAPLIDEVSPAFFHEFPQVFVGLTPQGFLRTADADGRVHRREWVTARELLPLVSATIISIEDVAGDWAIPERWAKVANVLVVTEGANGCTVFVRGEARHFDAPAVTEVDPTGAGDVFATAFFVDFYETSDAWHAARFASQMAAVSVTRLGLNGVPTIDEVGLCRVRTEVA